MNCLTASKTDLSSLNSPYNSSCSMNSKWHALKWSSSTWSKLDGWGVVPWLVTVPDVPSLSATGILNKIFVCVCVAILACVSSWEMLHPLDIIMSQCFWICHCWAATNSELAHNTVIDHTICFPGSLVCAYFRLHVHTFSIANSLGKIITTTYQV